MLRVLVVIGWLLVVQAPVRAETVALLPLDGDKRLEIYGQPVASEIGRALKAAGIDVVVVGAKMAVPDRAELIVDGTIKAGKGDAITLSIRVRDPRDGTVLETLPPSATTLTNIDKAAAELSARIVPSVKAHLEARIKKPIIDKPIADTPRPAAPTSLPPQAVLVAAVSTSRGADPVLELLRTGVDGELTAWARAHRREYKPIEPGKLAKNKEAPGNVTTAGADLGIALHVVGFSVTAGKVPLARARVRVRIVAGTDVKFDRVVRTDTIVGDRDMTKAALAARAAREVLAIINPHVRRANGSWK